MNNIPRFNSCDLLDKYNNHKDCIIFDLKDVVESQNSLVSIAHHHLFYQILFITSGNGKHFIDNKTFNINKGDLFFIAPGQVHKWDFNETTQGYILNFTIDFFYSYLVDKDFLNNFKFFSQHNTENLFKVNKFFNEFDRMFSSIKIAFNNKKRKEFNLLHVYVLELLLTAVELYESKNKLSDDIIHYSALVNNYEKLIDKHFYELRFPNDYAKLLHVSPNYLNSKCKKFKGQSSGELIRNRILLESKRLLVNTNLSVAEIAFKLSFKDNSYFSRFFKKYIGVSPDGYRRSK